jgi:VanZ family protein
MLKAYLPLFVWVIVITILSTMPGIQLPNFDLFSVDKLAHAFMYGTFVWLASWGFKRNTGRKPDFKEGFYIFLAAAGYGVFMEWVQGTFFPGRFCELDDMIANTFGAVVIWGILAFINKNSTIKSNTI